MSLHAEISNVGDQPTTALENSGALADAGLSNAGLQDIKSLNDDSKSSSSSDVLPTVVIDGDLGPKPVQQFGDANGPLGLTPITGDQYSDYKDMIFDHPTEGFNDLSNEAGSENLLPPGDTRDFFEQLHRNNNETSLRNFFQDGAQYLENQFLDLEELTVPPEAQRILEPNRGNNNDLVEPVFDPDIVDGLPGRNTNETSLRNFVQDGLQFVNNQFLDLEEFTIPPEAQRFLDPNSENKDVVESVNIPREQQPVPINDGDRPDIETEITQLIENSLQNTSNQIQASLGDLSNLQNFLGDTDRDSASTSVSDLFKNSLQFVNNQFGDPTDGASSGDKLAKTSPTEQS